MTDDEIRSRIVDEGEALIGRAFPGTHVKVESLAEALDSANANFEVAKRPVFSAHEVMKLRENPNAEISPSGTHRETYRTDTLDALGMVGVDYGVVQTQESMAAVDILAKRGDVDIVNVETIDGGARVRLTALLGVSSFNSVDGEPNTLCNFAVFEATHDGSACTTAALYTLRLECFNGMTSRKLVKAHKLRHTSKVAERVEQATTDILTMLVGDVEAERLVFESLAQKRMGRVEFEEFATELLGGELEQEASESKKTRRQNAIDELTEYFEGGNQGAGATAWGAYNSVTRWIEAKREGIEDARKAARKFDSNIQGAGQEKVARALKLLTR
jgi:hypothetical protein